MYLHIGLNYMIKKRDIIGIFDIETTTGSMVTRSFLTKAQKGNRIISVTSELPRSFIVCLDKGGKETVFLTSLSTLTLQKRNSSRETSVNWYFKYVGLSDFRGRKRLKSQKKRLKSQKGKKVKKVISFAGKIEKFKNKSAVRREKNLKIKAPWDAKRI